MQMWGLVTFITAIAAMLLALRLAFVLDLGVELQYKDSGCRLVGADVIRGGSEDIVRYRENIVFVSSGDLAGMFFRYPKHNYENGIYAVYFEDDGERIVKLKQEGLPEGGIGMPHGLFLSNETGRLYGIHHKYGELSRVVVFKISENDGGITLQYETEIVSPLFLRGALNQAVEGRLGEIYVTKWKNYDLHPEGRGNEQGLEKLEPLKDFLPIFVARTEVLRCTWDVDNLIKPAECETAVSGLYMANGMAIDPERKLLFVVDLVGREIIVHDRHDDGSLNEKTRIKTTYTVDNIHWHEGNLLAGAVGLTYKGVEYVEGDAGVEVPGLMLVYKRLTDIQYQENEVIVHDGSKLSMISVGNFVHNNAVLGSPASDGILVCPIQ